MVSHGWRDQAERQLSEGLQTLSITGTAAQVTQWLDFVALLHKWNKVYNLTSVRDPQQMITRHILDSLAILPYLSGKRCVDVGTGAGLPGIPLAIASAGHEFVLVDSNSKKTRFVRQAVTELGLANVEVVQARAETYTPATAFDVVLSRAFATLADMLSQAGHLCAAQGEILAMKGTEPVNELMDVPNGFTVTAMHRLVIPGLDEARHLVCLRRGSSTVK